MTWAEIADRVLKTTIATFKTSATYTFYDTAISPVTIDGVFDLPDFLVDPQTGAPVDSNQPTFGIRLADLPTTPSEGDTLTINAKLYRIVQMIEDTEGGVKFVLNKLS